MSIHDLKFMKQYNLGWVWEEQYVWRCPWAWTHSETLQNVTISFLNKSCDFQCHPSGGWHCSVGLSLMQLSAIKRLVPESCKVQEAEQNRKEEKRRKKKVLECSWSPLQAVGCTGSEKHTFVVRQGERTSRWSLENVCMGKLECLSATLWVLVL